jgi:ATP-dependent Clp protease adaptor protein ClpS
MARTNVQTKQKTELKYPDRFKILILNDDYTPFEFVIQLLIEVFNKSADDAKKITSEVHELGQGVVGYYNAEIAEQKSQEATVLSRTAGYPLVVKVAKA